MCVGPDKNQIATNSAAVQTIKVTKTTKGRTSLQGAACIGVALPLKNPGRHSFSYTEKSISGAL